jgi:YfiH family protein
MRQFTYKNEEHIFEEKIEGGVLYLSYPKLEDTGLVKHGFSTRVGGVSRGIFDSMNLSFTRGDDEEAVRENYGRMTRALGVEHKTLVKAVQTHTTCVHQVTKENKDQVLQDIDGLITDEKDVCLVTTYADCVPLFFVDPVHKAIGLSHSGWRGTVGKIGKETLRCMKEAYGTNPSDVVAAIGPSICQDCYEVSEDVIVQFKKAFDEQHWDALFYLKENGKYQLNLWKANEIILLEAGVLLENLAVTNVCTCCNSELLFSHRASKGERGGLAAFLALEL